MGGVGRETRDALLSAAGEVLRSHGNAAMTTRLVADRAGVPVSQIHYHFGGRQGLLLALLEDENARLLSRQRAMFGQDLPLWKRWEQACDFLEDDLDSGYVEILQELIAAGWSNDEIRDVVATGLRDWLEALTGFAEDAQSQLGFTDIRASDLARVVGYAFLGAEEAMLVGMERRSVVLGALRALGELIRAAEEG